MSTLLNEYYGHKSTWFIGTVTNIHSPRGWEGRVQVRITGVHSDTTDQVPDSNLPWALVVLPTTAGGTNSNLSAGQTVYGVFADPETKQAPIILGLMSGGTPMSSTQALNQLVDVEQLDLSPEQLKAIGKLNTFELNSDSKKAYDFFVKYWTPEQAAGIVGNLIIECWNFSPKYVLGIAAPDHGSIGIAQWLGSRVTDFQNAMGRPLLGAPLDLQLQFVQYEFEHKEINAANALRQETTVAGAARTVDYKYERSARYHTDRRIAEAIKVYNAYANGDVPQLDVTGSKTEYKKHQVLHMIEEINGHMASTTRDFSTMVVHWTQTYLNKYLTTENLDSIDKDAGFSDGIQYHYVIRRDGSLQIGRDINQAGYDGANTLSVCFVGGLACVSGTKNPLSYLNVSSLTPEQFVTFDNLVKAYFVAEPTGKVKGYSATDPGFDVVAHVKKIIPTLKKGT